MKTIQSGARFILITLAVLLTFVSCNNKPLPDLQEQSAVKTSNISPDTIAMDTAAILADTITTAVKNGCEKILLVTIENFKVWNLNNGAAIVFKAKMAIDADGSPHAYCPGNKGLDYTANAGRPGNWYGVVTDDEGHPVIQKNWDPYPGCYVSPTTMVNKSLPNSNPLKYCNSEEIPFIALPAKVQVLGHIKIGDMAYVYNTKNKKGTYAIFADGGPAGKLGEGSIYLADKLGINKSPRNGGAKDGIIYFIFPGSGIGNGTLRTEEEIRKDGDKEFRKIGLETILDCLSFD